MCSNNYYEHYIVEETNCDYIVSFTNNDGEFESIRIPKYYLSRVVSESQESPKKLSILFTEILKKGPSPFVRYNLVKYHSNDAFCKNLESLLSRYSIEVIVDSIRSKDWDEIEKLFFVWMAIKSEVFINMNPRFLYVIYS